jgi:SAM-dependent methyltransferase
VNEEQIKIWNGAAGAAWVESQESLDDMFRPFETLLLEASAASGARNVLDVGCGTGATTLALARTLPDARCTGIDVSQPMIDLARARARDESSRAEFLVADAQSHAFGAAGFDRIVSRFGVMFFEDPVAAFANLRRAAASRAELQCIAFRAAAENPFMTAAERAAAPLLPALPARSVDGPGQFAFADARKVQGILDAAGWNGVRLEPIDVVCVMPEAQLDSYLMRLGPVGLALRNEDEARRATVIEAVRAAFAPYVHGDEVRFTAACWEIAASA